MDVFGVISKHVNWASQRHAVAAANVANLDTPGFRAKQVSPFELEINATAMRLMRTAPAHLSTTGEGRSVGFEVIEQSSPDETHSGNNVSVEGEMRVIGEAARAVSGNTALYKLFHRMAMSAVKG